jgi:hypothetical protein
MSKGWGRGRGRETYLAEQDVHAASDNDAPNVGNGIQVLCVADVDGRVEGVRHARNARRNRNAEGGESGQVDAMPVVVKAVGPKVVKLDNVVTLPLDDPLRVKETGSIRREKGERGR